MFLSVLWGCSRIQEFSEQPQDHMNLQPTNSGGGDTTQQSIFIILFLPQARNGMLPSWNSLGHWEVIRGWSAWDLADKSLCYAYAMECWLFILAIILVRGFAGNFAGERCSCSNWRMGAAFLDWANSVHHMWFDYRMPFHVESEISVCFHLVPPRRSFYFFYSCLVDAEGEMHLLLHFALWQLCREFITVYFTKLYQKNNQSLIVFMAPFRTATQFSVALNKNWFSTDKSRFCHESAKNMISFFNYKYEIPKAWGSSLA